MADHQTQASASSGIRPASGEGAVRAGDHVFHAPSGETWVVAWADPSTNELAWCGWPDGVARLSDCTVVRAANDAQHQQKLRELKASGSRRGAKALRLYGEPVPACTDPTPTEAEGGRR